MQLCQKWHKVELFIKTNNLSKAVLILCNELEQRGREPFYDRDRGVRGRGGGGGTRAPPNILKIIKNYKELVRKNVLCLPNTESLMVPLRRDHSCIFRVNSIRKWKKE